MKKKIFIAAMLAVVTAVPVFAAVTTESQSPSDRFAQMSTHHQQMTQQAVDSGRMTAEQAAQMNEHMKEMAPVMQQMMQNGSMMGNGSELKHDNMTGCDNTTNP